MPWRGPEHEGEFPTLGYDVGEWIEAHCVVPDGYRKGEPLLLTDEMWRFLLHFYRLYEHADPLRAAHPDWGTLEFDFGRREVRNFLVANAVYWCEEFHIDGLRVDAVASMLYLDFSRTEWIPNVHGGRENLEAIAFLKRLNEVVHHMAPGCMIVAEESTAFPGVTTPSPYGLGFDYKWAMGWMNDNLRYFEEDPLWRKYHHHALTFYNAYRTTENYVLAISHEELRRVPEVIAIGYTTPKAEAVDAVLRSGMVTTLVTDHDTALRVLELAERRPPRT